MMIIAEGYVEEYHIDIRHEDVSSFNLDSEHIVTGRDLTLTLRIFEFDKDFMRLLHRNEPLKIVIDDRMPVSDDPRPKPIPKRIVTLDKTW